MIDVYSWSTPNGHKVHIALEELALDYRIHPVNIGQGDQFEAEFLRISPNNKIPAIVDRQGPGDEPFSLFESGAILIYLAEKAGRLLPSQSRERYRAIEWLMFQMGNLGPMLGQAHHFRQYAPERIDYAISRYTNETTRLYRVLDQRLGEEAFLAGPEYSIADIAAFPWIRPYERQGQDLIEHPNLKRWFDTIVQRPAVERGLSVLADCEQKSFDEEAKQVLFGERQYQRH
ncbi:glutathione binding-like protein [Nitrococcus mobilis]|uniref:Glutathione S-transferase-like protein n=1 Tax=Nitrococcus mobilis Nb-231 TaxID=314278 RepID=A4BUP2_9GAMM|nr:glutathione binding-like protein [Nitrococcus mobilis]EAR20608.1 Glutathione S-transferase-like protein [Nitrococcus mobilis Nb-231]